MRLKNLLFYNVLLFIATATIFGQGKEVNKTFEWNYKVNSDVKVILNNYDTDLIINTWDKDEIVIEIDMKSEFRSEKDADDLREFLDDLEFSVSAMRAEISFRFWKNRVNIMGRKTMTLTDNKVLSYKKFEMNGEIWVPEGCDLELISKYSTIQLDNIQGDLEMNLYNDDLFGKTVEGNTTILAKYADIEFEELADIDADLYSSDINTGNIGSLKLITKYSEFNAGDAGDIDIDAYEDDFRFLNTGKVKIESKYSDFIAESTADFTANNYEGKVEIGRAENVEFSSKYCKYNIAIAKDIRVNSSYEDNLVSEEVSKLLISESKYGKWTIGRLSGKCTLDSGYEDDFIFSRTGDNFKGIEVNGRYLTFEIGIPSSLNCRIKAQVKYPDFDVDEDVFKTRIKIKEGSELEYEATKGNEKDNMTELILTGYEVDLKVTEY